MLQTKPSIRRSDCRTRRAVWVVGGGGSTTHQLHGVSAMATGTRNEADQPARRTAREALGRAQSSNASRPAAGMA